MEQVLCSRNVYFQPPESLKIQYPAITYELSGVQTTVANNSVYREKKRYTVTFITDDPDSEKVDEFIRLPYCSFDRSYTSDNLNHYVFTIYY